MARKFSLPKSIPVGRMTREEKTAIRRGRREIERGEFVTYEQLKHELELDRRKDGTKQIKKTSRR